MHACQKESPVEAQAVNPHQVSTQSGNNDEHWYPPSPQPQGESVHQSTVGRFGASSPSTRTQALRVAPGPDVETRSGKGQSQACGKETQASQEGGGHSPLEPEAGAPTFTFEIRSTPTTSLEERETTHTSPKDEIAGRNSSSTTGVALAPASSSPICIPTSSFLERIKLTGKKTSIHGLLQTPHARPHPSAHHNPPPLQIAMRRRIPLLRSDAS